MRNYDNLRLRPSEFGKVVVGLDKPNLTDKQSQELLDLQAKEKRTDLQEQKLADLIAKRDAPKELSEGAKTYIREMVEADEYGYIDRIDNKYFDKGNTCEQLGIELLNQIFFEEYTKFPEGAYSNEWLISNGCDILHGDITRDVKCSWSKKTHPKTWEQAYNIVYEWQGRCYMNLFGSKFHFVDHVLIDTPEHLIKFEDASLHKMSNLTLEQRHTSIRFEFSKELDELIPLAVKLARTYANEYLNQINNNNKNY
jgi:hypothetical protein